MNDMRKISEFSVSDPPVFQQILLEGAAQAAGQCYSETDLTNMRSAFEVECQRLGIAPDSQAAKPIAIAIVRQHVSSFANNTSLNDTSADCQCTPG